MNDTIKALIDNLTYDNWFDQIAVIADAYEESGLRDEACVCRLFLSRKMIPEKSYTHTIYAVTYRSIGQVLYNWFNVSVQNISNQNEFHRHCLPFTIDSGASIRASKDIAYLFLYAVNRLKVWYPYHELRYIVECEQEGKAL